MTKRENMSETIASLRADLDQANEANEQQSRLIREQHSEIKEYQKRLSQPKFLLAKYRGVHPVSKFRVTFDAHVIEVDAGNSFVLPRGYDDIEVSVDEVKP